MATHTLPAPLVFLAPGRYRISRSELMRIAWTEPSKKDPKEKVTREDVYVLAVIIEARDEREVVLKCNGRFWQDFTERVTQVDVIARKFGKSGYDKADWVTTVDDQKRLVTID